MEKGERIPTADEYRDLIREELYFLNYLGACESFKGMTLEESVDLLTEELTRIL